MKEEVKIKTNLSTSLSLSILFITSIVLFYIIKPSIGLLITLLLAFVIFFQYLISKKISRIILDYDNGKVIFEYIQLTRKIMAYDKVNIKVKKRKDVYFRGGANEVFEIYCNSSNKKMFEISKRSFKTEFDYQMFVNLFSNHSC